MALSINPLVARLVCSVSGREVDARGFESPIGLCGCCPPPGKPVIVEYDLARARREIAVGVDALTGPGIWKYAPLLPVHGVEPEFAADVGITATERHRALSDELRVDVWLKNEGANPSGSFKDRGLAVGIALGVACGARRFCLPTQGNAGVAAALFSSRLGLPPALVYMPDGYQGGIYHRTCEQFGGEVRFFGANIAAAGGRMRDDLKTELASGKAVDLSTFFEPGRLEGKKTMGLEIFERFGADSLPDWILYPTGGGTGLVGIWKAIDELCELGLIERGKHRLPKMVAVQSESCAPVVRSFERGLDHVEPVESRGTVADGLDVPKAIMGHRMLATLRDSGGTAAAVGEESIKKAFADYGRLGVSAGYESAALLAALRELRSREVVGKGSRVLLLNTSSPLIALGNAGR